MVCYIYMMTLCFSVMAYMMGQDYSKPWFVIPMFFGMLFYFIADSKKDKLISRISELEKKVEELSK